jgi:hypothetical protein
LSRFIGAQRLAFAKLLKKYKKWANSDALENRFKAEVLGRPNSFTIVSLDECLDHWTEILQVVRSVRQPYAQSRGPPQPVNPRSPSLLPQAESPPRPSSSAIVGQLDKAMSSASEVRFDVAFAEAPIGESGARAVYWVHQEQLVELQVVLLQQMRLYLPSVNQTSGPSSLSQSPFITRRSSLSWRPDDQVEKEIDSGVVVLDQLQDYARRQSTSTVSDNEDASGKSFMQPAATARWATSEEAIVSITRPRDSGKAGLAKVKKKHLGPLLNVDRDFAPWKTSGTSTPIEGSFYNEVDPDFLTANEAREMLDRHPEVQPLASIFSKRTRFVGLSNTLFAGQWCILDSQISIGKLSRDDLVGKDWATKVADGASNFPYAVLEVRQEGLLAKSIIELLDKSHLTERVRGFSLYSHAVWQCWKPKSMSPPFWLPVLNRDIRKIPEAVPVPRRRSAQIQVTAKKTSTESEYNETTGSSTAIGTGDSSATSVPTTPVESRSFGGHVKKKKVSYHQDALLKDIAALKIPETRYWNEYDHPEDGSDNENGYYIYMDPNASHKMPGQEAAENFFARLKALFVKPRPLDLESQSLLSPHPSDNSSSPTSSDDDANVQILSAAAKKRKQRQKQHGSSSTYGSIMPSSTTSPGVASRPVSPRLFITTLSFIASTFICLIIATLAATGKKKLIGKVDAGILFGVVGSLFFALVGMVSVVTSHEHLGIVQWTVIGIFFTAICIADGVLVGWVVG